jgi:hypothetical protein
MVDRIRGLFVVACVLTAVVAGGNAGAASPTGATDASGQARAEANCLAHVEANDVGPSQRGGNCEHNWPNNQNQAP